MDREAGADTALVPTSTAAETRALPLDPTAAGAVALPAPGRYPVPSHHHKRVVERAWDGDVWLAEAGPAPAGTRLPHHKRHLFGFLRGQGWKLTLALVLCLGIASALWASDRHAHVVSGVQILLPIFVFGATSAVMLAILYFFDHRIGFDRIAPERRGEILRWGVFSGLVALAVAFAIEAGVPLLFGDSVKENGWGAIAGPAEETAKLLVPVLLWRSGRFRLPREGYLLVLICACTFGVAEGFKYAFGPDNFQATRPLMESLHPIITGFVAAVAWQAAWRGKTIFTGAAIGAWMIAMFAHSTNDFIALDKSAVKLFSFISVVVLVGMYLLQKHAARQMVPPDKVGEVSPRWRPVAPRGSDKVPA
jgi:hypothetical protein